MWTYEHSVETQADADAVFALFSDVSRWPQWNSGVERMELDGPFAAGTGGTMTIPGGETMASKLIWVEEGHGFEDETAVPDAGVVVRVRHTLEAVDGGGTRITFHCAVDGPGAAEVGAMVTADFPEVMAALGALAEGAR
ncbi:MAG: SRPBCC family protein [Candidatus Dormibacteraeota bacterium]|uniref:Polyketide cyclase n=1 Tax=Candidatus Aeolococcus gillhamiae TaxID=3127015 RepID=A0A2W5YZL5_9BACT|nr:SRPBCC family protein [Candidatus Dormibacteraeota bacterium]PZR78423.1 MAG: polyketide cyclase [Candidatus Dormibacter sp. RRmetagenome_bin12]